MPKKKKRRKSRPAAGYAAPKSPADLIERKRAAAPAAARATTPVSAPAAGAQSLGVARHLDRLVGGDKQRARIEDLVARMVNDVRVKAGLSALDTDERLRRSARGHSADMAARDYFAHEGPDGSTPLERMQSAGYADGAAENIARGQEQPESVVRAWLNSPGHRRNIFNPDFRTIGVGVHLGDGGPWWTQHFGY